MTRFDSWEAVIRPPEDYLMHWGIKGMKHGRNRYQNPDGTWTEEGLERRRQREGFGESRKERKLAKKVAKAEKQEARKIARAEAKAERAEIQRKKKLSGLTDEEMEAKLKRARMEQEYREITKKGSVLEAGSKLIGKYLDYQTAKKQQVLEANRQKLEMERLKTQQIQAKNATAQAKYNVKTSKHKAAEAKESRKEKQADVKGGLKIQRKKDLKQTKLNYRNTTTRGAIGNWLNARAKGAGEASGEYKKDKKHWEALVNGQRAVDEYNATRPKGQKKLQAEETVWQRQQTEQRERRANAEAVARTNVEKEKWKSKQKK